MCLFYLHLFLLWHSFLSLCKPKFLTYIIFLMSEKRFNIFCKAELLAEFPQFCLSEKVSIFLSCLKDNFIGYRIISLLFFLPFNTKDSTFLYLHGFWWYVLIKLLFITLFRLGVFLSYGSLQYFLSFLQCEHDIPSYRFFDIYLTWCFLIFLNLCVGVCY